MENSPNPLKKNTRLSFNSKHRLNDSPKTPIRTKKLASNDVGFETPPSRSKLNNINYFGEESPSQDYDYSLIPMSQDVIARYRDVTWKWNDDNDTKQTKPIKSKKEHRPPAIVQKAEKPTTEIFDAKQKIDKTKGFYKFQELLLAEGGNLKKLINKNYKINDDNNKCDRNCNEILQSSFKENIDTQCDKTEHKIKNSDLKLESKNQINYNKLSKCKQNDEKRSHVKLFEDNLEENEIINLLDDSDNDNLLVELTQTIENNIQNTNSSSADSEGSRVVNIGKRKTNLTKIKKTSDFDNDSIDELMLTLPMDDIKTSFPRHNSMPPEIQKNNIPPNNANIITLLRHNSANSIKTQEKFPINGAVKSINGDAKGYISPFSDASLESGYTAVTDNIPLSKKCTKAEVERKRQEAKLRRLQSQKRREFTQFPKKY